MTLASWPRVALPLLLLATLALQALWPGRRLLVVLSGAGLAAALSTAAGTATLAGLLGEVPWSVLVLLVGLGLLAELFVDAGLFAALALGAARASGGRPGRALLAFAVGMYAVSGLLNNLTALLLVLPVLLSLLRGLGVSQRYLSWTLGVLLIACNLGGAATPIGDFPAVLLLSRGQLSFGAYLVRALPVTALALAALLAVTLALVRPTRDLAVDPLGQRLSIAVLRALHRGVRLAPRVLAPPALALLGMLALWTLLPAGSSIGPELVCWLGVLAALVAAGGRGEAHLRRRVDVEAVLFLLSLFVLVGAARRAGLFEAIARWLLALPLGPRGRLVVFLVTAGAVTGVFSAGPGMAALLDVAEPLAREPGLSREGVSVALALAVCAGSSLFLTAATAGPLAQAITERADLRDAEGRPLRFGFVEFLPAGLLGFALIEGAALAYGLWSARAAP